MELVNINAYAEGYHSGSTYNEDIMITKQSYEKIKEEDLTIYIYDLDGKHSACEADISIDQYTEEQLLKMDLSEQNDGDDLYWHLDCIFNNHNMDLKAELKEVDDYLNSLDTFISFEVTVKKSQRDKVLEFIEGL